MQPLAKETLEALLLVQELAAEAAGAAATAEVAQQTVIEAIAASFSLRLSGSSSLPERSRFESGSFDSC